MGRVGVHTPVTALSRLGCRSSAGGCGGVDASGECTLAGRVPFGTWMTSVTARGVKVTGMGVMVGVERPWDGVVQRATPLGDTVIRGTVE